MKDDSVKILSQSIRRKAIMVSSGIGRDVHSSTLSIQQSSADVTTASPTLQGAQKDSSGTLRDSVS